MSNFLKCLFLLTSFVSFSQNYFEGSVGYIDNDGLQKPLTGVSVFWENTSIGTFTDSIGNFKIKKLNNSKKLLFKFLGFDDKIIKVDKETYSEILLTESQNVLDADNFSIPGNIHPKNCCSVPSLITVTVVS